eukprot:jgi/Botrbrau1/2898/Bobra.0036s0039.2
MVGCGVGTQCTRAGPAHKTRSECCTSETVTSDMDRSSSGKDSETDSCTESCGTVVLSHPLGLIDQMRGYDENQCSDAETASTASSSEDDEPFSEIGELDAAEVVYIREGVAMWPTRQSRIMGRLVLVRQQHVLFFSWLPYSPGTLQAPGSFVAPSPSLASSPDLHDRTMYAVHSIPLVDVKSIQKHAPSFGWQYIVVVLNTGVSIPPLFFTTGGVKAFFSVLKQYVSLAKSLTDASTYLVNDVADPLQRSLTSLHLADALLGGPLSASPTFPPPYGPVAAAWAAEGEGGRASPTPLFMSQMLDGVQRLSLLARDATNNLLGGASFLGPAFAEEGWLGTPQCAPQQAVQHASASSSTGEREGDSASAGQREEGACQSEGEHASTLVGSFELVDKAGLEGLNSPFMQRPPPPLDPSEWATFFSDDGRCLDEKGLRRRIFHSGLEASVRKEAWLFLLGVFSFSSTHQERELGMRRLRKKYRTLKRQWTSITPEQAANDSKWRERRVRVDKDVWRTDRSHPFFAEEGNRNIKRMQHILLTYCKWNFDLGYCQGMSDLVAPLLYIMRDEAKTFWCFSGLMERMGLAANFHTGLFHRESRRRDRTRWRREICHSIIAYLRPCCLL